MRYLEKCRDALSLVLAFILFSCLTNLYVVAHPGGCISCVDPNAEDAEYYAMSPPSVPGSSSRHFMPPAAAPVLISGDANVPTIAGTSASAASSGYPLGYFRKSQNYLIYCDKTKALAVRNALREAKDAMIGAINELQTGRPGHGYRQLFDSLRPNIVSVAYNRALRGYPIVSKVNGNPQALPPKIVCAEEHMEVVYGVSQAFNDACKAHPAAPAFYPLDTPYIIICKPFFDLHPHPDMNHCPSWDKDAQHFRPGQQTALTTLYQSYVLIQKLVHAYLDNPLGAGTRTPETYDWDQMLLLSPADMLNNPPTYDFWAACESCCPLDAMDVDSLTDFLCSETAAV